jgi:glycosyltransferase involved in cell wall biosynthesis
MKITFVLTWADHMGGTERTVFSQARYLAQRHDVEIVSVFRTAEDTFFDSHVPVRYLIDRTGAVPRPVRDTDADEETCRRLAAFTSTLVNPRWEPDFDRMSDLELELAMRELETDIVVTTSPALMLQVTAFVPPRVVTVHQEHRIPELRGDTGEPLYAGIPRLDALVVLGERSRIWAAESFGAAAPRVEAIPNPLPGGHRPKSTRESRVVTMAARLVKDKQADHAIRAFAQVAREHPDWTLRIFGEGPQAGPARKLVDALELQDHVQIVGPSPHMPEEWAKASVAVHPASVEPFGLVLIEALAAGVPVVTYDCPNGPAEIITHGEDGFLVSPGDVDGLATSLSKLIEDRELRETLGRAALRAAERFEPERVMARWERLYGELLAGRDDPRRTARRLDRVAAMTVAGGGSGFVPAAPLPPRPLARAFSEQDERRIREADATLVRSGGQLARLADDLMPTDVTQANLDLVVDVLESAGIPYWLVRTPEARHRVGVEAGHRADAMRSLARAYATAAVYAETLGPTGRPDQLLPMGLLEPGKVGGLRVFRPVVTSTRTLRYGPAYGCDLEFWERSGDDLVPPRPTILGATLARDAMAPAVLRVGERDYTTAEPFTRSLVDDVDFPIDAVYTWVDGADPAWLERRNAALSGPALAGAGGDARFRSRDELRYSLRSLEMFAPWLNHIWILTDRQVPSWLDTAHPKITVVDHREVFGDDGALPTFNSHAIETRLHHIDGLAEHFLYFNDDVFLGRPLPPSRFFQPNRDAVFFRSPTSVALTPVRDDDDFNFAAAKNNRRLIEEAFGLTLTHAFLHVPHALRRGVLAEIEERFAADVGRTARSRFRSRTDVAVPSSLHHYYGYLTGQSAPGTISFEYVDVGEPGQHPKLTQLLTQRHRDVFCLNDTHHGTLSPEEQEHVVSVFLESYFPVAASHEKGSLRNLRV